MKTLFKNCDIITRENDKPVVIREGFLCVDGDTISYVGNTRPEGEFDTEKDMGGAVLMPGLINCHNHCPMVLLRGVGSDLSLQKWLFDTIFPIEDRLTPAQIKAGTELAILEMLATGTTSFSDMYMEPKETIGAVISAGMKANICRPVQEFDPSGTYENNFRAKESLALFDELHMAANGRIRIDFSIHAEYTCNANVVRGYSEECLKRGGRMHLHLSETKKEVDDCVKKYDMTPPEWFNSLGTFDSPVAAAHCVWLSESDMELLKEKNVSVIHNPTSNMKLGSGFSPTAEMLGLGINVALGTDGAASNNNLNMFEEMHLASIIHNGYTGNPEIMKAPEVLDMATVNGAKLQGREDTGSLEVGKKADIIAVSLDAPHMYPAFDAVNMMTYSAQGSDVIMTMVDGKVLYEKGEFLTIDRERVMYDVKKAVKDLYSL